MSGAAKSVLWTALLLLVSSGLADAETFKCTHPDGTLTFTDEPSEKHGDCQRLGDTALPVFGVSAPQQQPAPPPFESPIPAPPAQAGAVDPFPALNSEVTSLVEKFQAARRQLYFSSFAKDQLAARRELNDIRAQKSSLLSSINNATLSAAEKQHLVQKLAVIDE